MLGQRTVPRVNRIGIGDFGRAQNPRDVPVTLVARRRPNAYIFIGSADVQRIGVGLRMNGHRLDPKFFAGTNDPKCDFAPICDEDFLKQCVLE